MKEIYSTQELLTVEQDARKAVWVLAPDIAIGPQEFGPVMRTNIYDRNVEYRYLVVNHANTLVNLVQFVSRLLVDGPSGNFEVAIVPQEIVESDVTIIDGDHPSELGFVLSPAENDSGHFRIHGSALFRIKERFSTLWRLADEIDTEAICRGEDIEGSMRAQKPLNGFWPSLLRAQAGRYSKMWSRLGRVAHRLDTNGRSEISDIELVRNQIMALIESGASVPTFSSVKFPEAISDDADSLSNEILSAFISGANSASIAMCGKLLELSLREYYRAHSENKLSEQLMLGKLIRRVNEDLGVQLDEGLLNIVNFINQFRISGVHVKQGFSLPTDDQTRAVVYMTYDTVRKLF